MFVYSEEGIIVFLVNFRKKEQNFYILIKFICFKVKGKYFASKYSGLLQASSLIIKEEGITALWQEI